jgi:hypothetical protein
MTIKNPLYLLLLLLSVLLYIPLIAIQHTDWQVQAYFLILVVQFSIYAVIIRNIFRLPTGRISFKWLLICAGLYRLLLLFSHPLPFFHDPRVISAGYWPLGYGTDFSAGIVCYVRIILLLPELALGFLLLKLIRRFSIDDRRLFIVFLNPLWMIEIFMNGRGLLLAVLLLWLTIYLFYTRKETLSLAVMILSCFGSLLSLPVCLPLLYKRIWLKTGVVLLGIILAVFVIARIDPSYKFIIRLDREAITGAAFSIILFIFDKTGWVGQESSIIKMVGNYITIYLNTQFYVLLLAFVAGVAVIISQIQKLKMTANFYGSGYLQAGHMIMGALLLLSPLLYPHHLLWILPFIIFFPSWSWIIFTLLIQLVYLILPPGAGSGDQVGTNWILLSIYLPFFMILLFEYLDRRRIKGWF